MEQASPVKTFASGVLHRESISPCLILLVFFCDVIKLREGETCYRKALMSSDDSDARSPRKRFDKDWRHSGPFPNFVLDKNMFLLVKFDRGAPIQYSLKLNPPLACSKDLP